jgi:hypothetical protein
MKRQGIIMIYRIFLKISGNNDIKLDLVEKKKITGSLDWRDNNNLSRLLLLKIDELLRKGKIGLDKISGYKIISEVPENYTSFRIAKITLESLIIGKKWKSGLKQASRIKNIGFAKKKVL